MGCAKTLQAIVWMLALTLSSFALAQEKKKTTGITEADATVLFGGNADRWLIALIDSRDNTDSSVYLDRLSYFHLTTNQLEQLLKAAAKEESDEKRVILWHAIRQSRDTRSRDFLIKTLVDESTVDEQVEFIEQLTNPTRFDVPILVALYNSQRPKKKKNANSPGEQKPWVTDDLHNVPLKIVELTCHTEWSTLSTMTSYQYPGDQVQEDAARWVEVRNKRSNDAHAAQEEFTLWLVKNGFDDNHRIDAFHAYLTYATFWEREKVYINMGRELLRGMNNPESKAKALPLLRRYIEPVRFLTPNEAEIVRLQAIHVMEEQVLYAFSNQIVLSYWDVMALYRPVLENAVDSDPSPKVKAAAERLLERIAETEVEFGKSVGRAK